MNSSYFFINSDNDEAIALIKNILAKNSGIVAVAQGNNNMKSLAPLAMENKGRLTTYKADLADPVACGLFIKDAFAYSGVPEKLIFIFSGSVYPAGGFIEALQRECGSAFSICEFFIDKMEKGSEIVFINAGAQNENASALDKISAAAVGAYSEYLTERAAAASLGFSAYSTKEASLDEIVSAL